jgi:hypothetical protein
MDKNRLLYSKRLFSCHLARSGHPLLRPLANGAFARARFASFPIIRQLFFQWRVCARQRRPVSEPGCHVTSNKRMWSQLPHVLLDKVDDFLAPDFTSPRAVCRSWRFRRFRSQHGLTLCLELARAKALLAKFRERDLKNVDLCARHRFSDIIFAAEIVGFEIV